MNLLYCRSKLESLHSITIIVGIPLPPRIRFLSAVNFGLENYCLWGLVCFWVTTLMRPLLFLSVVQEAVELLATLDLLDVEHPVPSPIPPPVQLFSSHCRPEVQRRISFCLPLPVVGNQRVPQD